jgi:23S rRNA pseudouridine1911/1915/1917 synthase
MSREETKHTGAKPPRKPRDKKDKPKEKVKKHSRMFHIVFEDAHILVVDKPPGILTVPLPGKSSRNLKDLLNDYLTKKKRTAHPVHRIDRYTSGLVVFAKTQKARDALVEQFKNRTPERVYLALVRGTPPEAGTLRHRLELTTDGFRQHVVRVGGTEAVTHFKVLEQFDNLALLEVRLETGLKNQIRVQFSQAGHPLVGDRHYNPSESEEKFLTRQALHAWKLGFAHPETRRMVSFEAQIAPDMGRLLTMLRKRQGKSEG